MVKDLVHNLCDSLVENIGGVADIGKKKPTPITYLTKWMIVGNSEVHTDPYLTSWKVSGNSVVDNNTILSCGDLGQDGKYHVKISNGVTIFDIPLDAPLRKVKDVADTIEYLDSLEIVRFASYFNIPLSNINHALRNYNFYDYMSSTNTSGQYIDTGLRIGGTDSVDFRVKFALKNAGGWFGAFDGQTYSSPGFYGTDVGGNGDIISLCCGSIRAFFDYSVKSIIDSSLYLIKTYAFTKMPSFNGVNGEKNEGEISNATYTPTHNAFIFARNNAGTPSSTRLMSVYSLIVHGKGVFVVAERKSDNAIGLLNLLDSNPATQLHTNQGSGNDFTLGSQITFEQLCSDIMDGYSDAPAITDSKALVTIRVEENGGELSPLDTPTTELVDVSPFSVSPTDTYTSANATPYSAFEYKKNVEIWSCGEYNPTDGKYHILVQPQGGNIADIALDAPLRKVNDVADSISLLRDNDYAYVIRYLASSFIDKFVASRILFDSNTGTYYCGTTSNYTNGVYYDSNVIPNLLCNKIENVLSLSDGPSYNGECIMMNIKRICVKNAAIEQTKESYQSYFDSLGAIEIIYKLATPIFESIDAIQIEKADSYSMVISQGGKAVGWSEFIYALE